MTLKSDTVSRFQRVLARWVAAMCLVTGLAGPLPAQDALSLAPPDRTSPLDWVTSFLSEAKRFEAAYAAYVTKQNRANADALARQMAVLRRFFDLSDFPIAFRNKVGGEAATEMMDILNRLPMDALLSGPSDTTDAAKLPDQWTIPGSEIVLVRQRGGMDGGLYLVPQEVITLLPDFHNRVLYAHLVRNAAYANLRSEQMQTVGPMVPLGLVGALPSFLKQPFLGTPVWKQLVAVCCIVLVLLLNVNWSRLAAQSNDRLPEALRALLRLSGPALLAASFLLLHHFIEFQLNVQGVVAIASLLIRNLAIIAAGAWLVWAVAQITSEALIRSDTIPEDRLDAHLTRLISRLIGAAGAAAVVVYGLGTIGIPAAGLITGIGVGGVGIALAARETIENLFGGIVLLMDRPFRVSDWIVADGKSGQVLDIGSRSCRLQTAEGTMIVIPNGALSTQPITNLGRTRSLHLKQVLPLPASISRLEVENRLSKVRAALESMPRSSISTSRSFARPAFAPDGAPQIEVEISLEANGSENIEAARSELVMALLGVGFAAPDHAAITNDGSQRATT